MADIFSNKTIEENDNENKSEAQITFEALVGEEQKYKTPDDLAKAYGHADAHISKLEREMAEMRAENKVLKDLAETPKKKQEDDNLRSQEPDPADDPSANRNKVVDENVDLNSLIREELDKADKERSFSGNVNAVAEKLEKFYGSASAAQRAVAEKAKELNVGVDWLMDIAGKSPSAFYNTVGIDQRSFSTPSAGGDVNTQSFGRDANRKNFAYYENIRKTDPKLYYSAGLRKEMFAQAQAQGERFYS